MSKLEIGTRFTYRTSRPWKDGTNTRTQVEVALCEVKNIEAGYANYQVVEILAVENAPARYQPSTEGAVRIGAVKSLMSANLLKIFSSK